MSIHLLTGTRRKMKELAGTHRWNTCDRSRQASGTNADGTTKAHWEKTHQGRNETQVEVEIYWYMGFLSDHMGLTCLRAKVLNGTATGLSWGFILVSHIISSICFQNHDSHAPTCVLQLFTWDFNISYVRLHVLSHVVTWAFAIEIHVVSL